MTTNHETPDLDFIKDVISRMNTQDNRGTAAPYFYQIETFERMTSVDGDFLWYLDDTKLYTDDDIKEYLIDHECDLENDPIKVIEDLGFEKWHFERKGVLKGFFLTEDAAKQHLKCNDYHYSHDARTYVSHAWRSPEFMDFIEAVARLVEMQYKPKGSY